MTEAHKRLLAVIKPKKKIGEMTDEERWAFASQILGAAFVPEVVSVDAVVPKVHDDLLPPDLRRDSAVD
jgi:hypothetical protein